MEKLMTLDEAVELLERRWSKEKLRREIGKLRLDGAKIGKHWYVTERALEDWITKCRVESLNWLSSDRTRPIPVSVAQAAKHTLDQHSKTFSSTSEIVPLSSQQVRDLISNYRPSKSLRNTSKTKTQTPIR